MALEGLAPPGTRPGLPPLGIYLRTVVALGMGSLRLALPAIAFLYFYRLGMDLYLAFSSGSSTTWGGYDQSTLAATLLMQAAAYLPLLVLIYTPFLPLQDAILAGRGRSFFESIRMVLERLIPFAVSAIAQGLLLLGPPAFLFAGVAILVRTVPTRPDEMVRVLAVATLIPCFFYVLVMGLFLLFATPAVVMDRRGPFASIRVSFSLVARHFGGILGRLLVFLFLLLFAAMALSLPSAFLQVAASATGVAHPAFRIAGAIWSAAVAAFLFPFTVASLMILYRSVAPSGEPAVLGDAQDERAGGTEPGAAQEPRRATSPYQFE